MDNCTGEGEHPRRRGICSGSGVTHLQQQPAVVLDRQRITLAGLHFGIDGLAKCRSDTLCFSIAHILDKTPQVAPHALLSATVDILTDIGLWDTVTWALAAVAAETPPEVPSVR